MEAVEKMVEIIREHYEKVYFIIPRFALSAGTIFCMSGDKLYMDYSSSLGPIDPQVLGNDRNMVPALGYLDKVQELVQKSMEGKLSPVEFSMLERLDLAMLRRYEQARELSKVLLEKWLVNYKFSNWKKHRTTNPGTTVTDEDKKKRAAEIAKKLSDNNEWHSHGRMISMQTLTEKIRLEIDDFGKDKELQNAIGIYNDVLTDYAVHFRGQSFLIYNRKTEGGE